MPELTAPDQIEPQSLGDYLEILTKVVFQSGISWKVVESKWPGIREAFRNFDPEVVAAFGPDDVEALVTDKRVIRNRRKLEAIVGNARQLLELDQTHSGFRAYLRSHPDFPARVKAVRKQFKFVGDMGCYYFLYVVGEEVPPHEEWMSSRKK